MQIRKIFNKILLVLMLIIMCNTYICYATVNGNDERGLPTLDDSYRPEISISTDEENGSTIKIITHLLTILTIVGIIAVVVSIAIIGFSTILGSAAEKALNQEKFIGILIASLLITGGSIIARLIISVAESI